MPLTLDIRWHEMEPTETRRLNRIVTTLNNLAWFLLAEGHVDEAIETFEALSWGDESFEACDHAFGLGMCF